MAGLLSGVLPWAFSQGDRAKRFVGGLLSDPLGSMEQTAGQLQDNNRKMSGLLIDIQNGNRGEPLRQATDMTLGGLLGFAPVGMTAKVGGMAAKIDELTGLPLNADGTVTVYHHTSKANADNILKQRTLKSAGEPHVYFTSERNPVTGYGDTVVPVNINPNKLMLDDEFPDGRKDFSVDVKRPGGLFRF